MVKALMRAGFTVTRISGSHASPDDRTVVVPVHVGQDIPKGTLRNILSIVGMTADELRKLL